MVRRLKSLLVPGEPTYGWMILIGGGDFSFQQTEEADRFALSKLPPANRSIAFLPTASGSEEYGRHFRSYIERLEPGIEFVTVPIYRGRDARREKNLAMIRNSGMVYVGGGSTNPLITTIKGTPVEDELKRALERGAVICAIAASAAAFGVVTQDSAREGQLIEGFGWLPGAVVEPGFDPKNDRWLRTMMAQTQVQVGFAIPARTALAIAPDRQGHIVGEGQVAVVRKPPPTDTSPGDQP